MKYLQLKYLTTLLFACVLCYAWFVLVVGNGDLLYTIQDFSPWLGTGDYLMQMVSHPGGLREWVGDWLTQLFFYPWLGGTVMVMMWAVSAWLMARACRLQHGYELLSLIPVLALMTGITQLGYWVFCLKTASYWFGPAVGFLCIALFAYLFAQAGKKGRAVILSVWVSLGYFALGWMATIGFVVMLLLADFRQKLSDWLLLLVPSLVLFFSMLLYFSDGQHTLWRGSLLMYGFPHVVIPEAESKLLEVAPIVFSVVMVLLPLIGRWSASELAKKASLVLNVLLMGVSLYGANMMNYRNANFHAELTMMRLLEEGRWQELLDTMRKATESHKPTREMVLMKDVALAQTGKLGASAFEYDIRGVNPAMVVNLPIHMVHSAGPTIYYWLGMPNYAYMWSMENSIEYGISPHWLRLFYRSAVVNGETEVARKYQLLLQTTLFHKNVTITDEECKAVQRFMTGHNHLDNDGGFTEGLLMRLLSQEEYDSVEGQQIALHYAMLMRNGELFAKALDHYVELTGDDQHLPVYYQEALLLFAEVMSDHDEEMIGSLPISKEVRERFENYKREVSFDMQQPVPTDKLGDRYYKRYGNTYWWYYDFYINKKTY